MSTGPRIARAYLALPSKILFGFLASLVAMALSGAPTRAQGTVPLKTVVTDQTQLSLSNSFGTPSATAIDQKGDFAFIGEGNSGLFMRAYGATSVTRLLQNGDAVPNIAGSTITSFVPTIYESQAGVLFAVNYVLADGVPHQGICVWSSGTTYTTIATDSETAPGTTSETYGMSLQPLGINDTGDVAFSSIPSPADVTIFVTSAGGTTTRILGGFDTVTNPANGSTPIAGSVRSISGINAQGNVLLSIGALDAYETATKTGQLALVADPSLPTGAANGGCVSGPSAALISGSLNNTGITAFAEATGTPVAICYTTAGSVPAMAASTGSAAPAPLTGTLSLASEPSFALDDSGDIVFDSGISSGNTSDALLQFNASTSQLSVVAYQGETEPSGTTKTFASFLSFAVSSDGTTSFVATFTQGGFGLYQQSGTNAPLLLAMEGAPAPTGAGTIDFAQATSIQALNNHSVWFPATITGGSAYFAEMLATPGTPASVQSLVSTGDTLPSGSRVQLSGNSPAAGNYVGFSAQNSGGRTSFFVANTASGANTKIVTEGDTAPGTGGVFATFQLPALSSICNGSTCTLKIGLYPAVSPENPTYPFYVNASGEIAFNATIAGSGSQMGIFVVSPTAGLSKVATTGDVIPQPQLSVSPPIAAFLQLSAVTSPLNDDGELAFFAVGGVNTGLFRYNPDGTITTIVPTQAPPASFPLPLSAIYPLAVMNQSGLVGFQSSGFFEGDGSASPQGVAVNGDPIAGTTATFGFPTEPLGLSNSGTLAYMATEAQTNPSKIFIGTATSTGTAALVVSGGPAPGGGFLNFTTVPKDNVTIFFPGIVQENSEGDIAFFSPVAGGSGNSGYFLSPGTGTNAGVLQPLVLQGGSLPSGGTLNTIPTPGLPGGSFSLGPDGRLIFTDTFTNGSNMLFGLFLAAPNGSLGKIVAAGDAASSGGTVTAVQIADGQAAGAPGNFAFWTAISGGGAHQAILVAQLPSGTNATTTTVTSSSGTALQGASVTLTATVTSIAQGAPAGTITFFDSGAALGAAVALSNGAATFSTSSLAIGSHSITAQYSGDNTFAASTSATFTQAITGPPDFSVTVSPSSLTITAGQSGQITITVTPINGSMQAVSFSCSGLPSLATCTASPSSVTLDGTHAATTIVTIQTAATGNLRAPVRVRREPPPVVAPEFVPAMPSAVGAMEIALGLLVLLYAAQLIGKRRMGAVAFWTIVAGGLLMAGCGGGGGTQSSNPGGGGSSGGTPSGNYSVTLTIAAGSDSHTASASITVTR